MRGKILFVTGLAVGYVLGAKAGRERYEKIAAAANKFWSTPTVQRRVDQVEDFVKDHAPDVAGFVGDTAKKAVSKVASKPRRGSSTARSASSQSSSSPAAPAAAKSGGSASGGTAS